MQINKEGTQSNDDNISISEKIKTKQQKAKQEEEEDKIRQAPDRFQEVSTKDNNVTLVYSPQVQFVIDRDKLANSCQYFYCMLKGHYKETCQQQICLDFKSMFSSSAFAAVVEYLNYSRLEFRVSKVALYVELIQLGDFLLYDDLIEVCLFYLSFCISQQTIPVIYKIAIKFNCRMLINSCIYLVKKGIKDPGAKYSNLIDEFLKYEEQQKEEAIYRAKLRRLELQAIRLGI